MVIAAVAQDRQTLQPEIDVMARTLAEVGATYARHRPLITAGPRDEEVMKQFRSDWELAVRSILEVIERAKTGDVDGMLLLYRGADRRDRGWPDALRDHGAAAHRRRRARNPGS